MAQTLAQLFSKCEAHGTHVADVKTGFKTSSKAFFITAAESEITAYTCFESTCISRRLSITAFPTFSNQTSYAKLSDPVDQSISKCNLPEPSSMTTSSPKIWASTKCRKAYHRRGQLCLSV